MKKYNINEFRAKDWYKLGYDLANPKKKIKCFKKAVALDPLHGPAWHFLGSIYNGMGDFKMEKFCNQKALEAYKAGLQRYRRKITKEEWNIRNEETKKDEMSPMSLPKPTYDVISSIDTEIDDILENLARLYWNMAELEKAAECYDRLIELYPNWASPHRARGEIYVRLGEHLKAIDDLRFAVEDNHADFKSYYLLGMSYSIIGNADRSKWYFRKAKSSAENSPDSIDAAEVRADSSYELEDYGYSIDCYKEILKRNPKNTYAWNKMGEAHLAKGDNKQAKRCFEKACKISQSKNSNDGVGTP